MLSERPARALRYDPATDEAHLEVGGGEDEGEVKESPERSPRKVEGQLLLDAAGFLVGVDLGGEGLSRAVVMLGPHENVARTEPAALLVHVDGSGGAAQVTIAGAKAALRGGEKNPYV
jgi:hypothetical protein